MQQLDLVYRYLERIRRIRKGVKANLETQIEYEDDALMFFVHCHHMYDWLCNMKDVHTVVSRKDVSDFINSHEELRVCADVCNWTKHSKVTNKRTGNGLTAFRAFDVQVRNGNDPTPLLVSNYTIECGGKSYCALDLAEVCYDLWNSYVQEIRSQIIAGKT